MHLFCTTIFAEAKLGTYAFKLGDHVLVSYGMIDIVIRHESEMECSVGGSVRQTTTASMLLDKCRLPVLCSVVMTKKGVIGLVIWL